MDEGVPKDGLSLLHDPFFPCRGELLRSVKRKRWEMRRGVDFKKKTGRGGRVKVLGLSMYDGRLACVRVDFYCKVRVRRCPGALALEHTGWENGGGRRGSVGSKRYT